MTSPRGCVPLALALSLLSARSFAQAPPSQISLWPGAAGFATRGFVPDDHDGVIAVAFEATDFRGSGGASGSLRGRVDGFHATVQNQDATRAMSFSLAAVADDDRVPGTPDLMGVLVQTTEISTPISGLHAAAYRVSVSFGTAAEVLPRDSGWHLVLRVPRGAERSVLYVHAADDRIGSVGDNARRGARSTAQSFDLANGVMRDLPGRSFDLAVLTDAPVLQVGADIDPALRRGPHPAFGRVGVFPDRARGDGLAFRVQPGAIDSGMVVILGTPLGFAAHPSALFGLDGEVLLTVPLMPAALLIAPVVPGRVIEAVSPRAPYPFRTTTGSLQFQAALVPNAGTPVLTNAVASHDR